MAPSMPVMTKSPRLARAKASLSLGQRRGPFVYSWRVTHDCQRTDNLLWRIDVGANYFRDEVRRKPDNADHSKEGETSHKYEGLCQRCSAIVWNSHVAGEALQSSFLDADQRTTNTLGTLEEDLRQSQSMNAGGSHAKQA
ncbi:hypothetical protein KC341_g20 [Hortaea werneckii]|nr:hypothetical protein KC341_g20 [Hortaea werneckii]